MPLKSGYSQATISENIAKLIRDGYSKQEAAAIALEEARKAKRKEKDEKGESRERHSSRD